MTSVTFCHDPSHGGREAFFETLAINPTYMKALEGKVAVITGAGSGIGKAIALLFAKNGARVMLADLRQENMEAVAIDIRKLNGSACCYACDVSQATEVELLVEETLKVFETVDILVNNAGIMDNFAPVADTSDKLWNSVIGTNLNSVFYLCRKTIELFIEKGNGTIINIASIGGLFGGRAGAAYTASKHAVVGLTKNIGYQYANKNIRCNAIAPGSVNTNITLGMKAEPFGFDRMIAGTGNMPPAGTPEDIAELALFLADPSSAFINGAVITADGGWTAY